MEDAAQSVAFVARQRQGGAAMRTAPRQHADAPAGAAKGHQVLAQQAERFWRAVGNEARGADRWRPDLAEHLAHRSAGADPGYSFVVLPGKHFALPACAVDLNFPIILSAPSTQELVSYCDGGPLCAGQS